MTEHILLSYDITVIQNNIVLEKLYGHTCKNILEHTSNIIDKDHLNNAFSYRNIVTQPLFKGSYDKQNLTVVVIS